MEDRQDSTKTSLKDEHVPGAMRARLRNKAGHGYLGDAILGGIDGSVTTFAIVSDAVGGGFSSLVIVVLGIANLLADGFSIGVSNYCVSADRSWQRMAPNRPLLRSGLETLLTGSSAVVVAYLVGYWLRQVVGVT